MNQGAPHANKLHALLRSGRFQKIPKGQVFQSTDDKESITLVNKGYIKRYLITSEGTESIQIIYGPGFVFPLTPIFKLLLSQSIYSGPETFYYEAMCDTELYTITREVLIASVEKEPLLYRDLLQVSGTRLNEYVHSLENIAMGSAYGRVAHQLLFYAHYFGEKSSKGTTIAIPLTQQSLANVLNITRETTSVSMTKLREKGLIAGTKTIVVPDIEALEEEVYSSPPA
jgi:CRP/FNR family cyclic AMP-dependent transcriptional regulator